MKSRSISICSAESVPNHSKPAASGPYNCLVASWAALVSSTTTAAAISGIAAPLDVAGALEPVDEGGHDLGHYLTGSLLWSVALIAVFAPLAVWRFRKS
jgi:hypothetical protein